MIKSSTFNHLFFVYSSSVCEAHSVYLSSFLRSLFICLSSLHRLSFVIPSFFVHLPVRLAPSFVRLLFVFCSSFVRLLFVISLSALVVHTVFCSFIFLSHFSVTTLPLLGRSLRIGEYVIGERIFPSSFHYLGCASHTNFDIPKICHTFALLIPKNNLYYGKKSKCYFKRTLWYDW